MSNPLIREKIIQNNGLVSNIWALWFTKIRGILDKGEGVSGTFTTADAKTVTVENGVITSIV